jgi:phosphohistidine phosphatase
MKRLLLMRHAKTENWYQGTDDEGRALVARGWADARLVGEALLARGWVPNHVLVSTARRTRETWSALSEFMPQISHDVLEDLYLSTKERLLDLALRALEETETLLVIGHNPGVHELASDLAEAHSGSDYDGLKLLERKMPTCAVALFGDDETGAPLDMALRLVEFITVKPLREP